MSWPWLLNSLLQTRCRVGGVWVFSFIITICCRQRELEWRVFPTKKIVTRVTRADSRNPPWDGSFQPYGPGAGLCLCLPPGCVQVSLPSPRWQSLPFFRGLPHPSYRFPCHFLLWFNYFQLFIFCFQLFISTIYVISGGLGQQCSQCDGECCALTSISCFLKLSLISTVKD